MGSLYNSSSADVNGDGHVDLLLARDYRVVSLMIHDDGGSFTNETAKRLPRPVDHATCQVDAASLFGGERHAAGDAPRRRHPAAPSGPLSPF